MLVSVMLANNETGVINDLKRIVEVVRVWQNEKADGEGFSKEAGKRRRIFVHTDAAQAIGKIKVDVQGGFYIICDPSLIRSVSCCPFF